MKVIIEEDRCVGCGQCVLIAPSVFDQRDDGVVRLLKSTPTEDEQAAVGEAVRGCPSLAIWIETSTVS